MEQGYHVEDYSILRKYLLGQVRLIPHHPPPTGCTKLPSFFKMQSPWSPIRSTHPLSHTMTTAALICLSQWQAISSATRENSSSTQTHGVVVGLIHAHQAETLTPGGEPYLVLFNRQKEATSFKENKVGYFKPLL